MYTKRYKTVFSPMYCKGEVSQVDGLSMREIYRRFVNTGEINATVHQGSYGNDFETAFNPDLDVVDDFERRMALAARQEESVQEQEQESVQEQEQESVQESE